MKSAGAGAVISSHNLHLLCDICNCVHELPWYALKNKTLSACILMYRQNSKLFGLMWYFPLSWDIAISSPNFSTELLVCSYFILILMKKCGFCTVAEYIELRLRFPNSPAWFHAPLAVLHVCPAVPLGSWRNMWYTDVYHIWLYGHKTSSILKIY